ncbi:MAG: transglycosylase domain-containing protein [Micromonosporaceae bacterium]|jgi:membrane peptidoglycan carboxypeptidase
MRPREHNIFTDISGLLVSAVVAGLALATALFPVAWLSGLLARDALEEFQGLPAQLAVQEGPQISYLYASDGETLLAVMYDENRRAIPLSEVPQVMIDAVLAAEDRNFYHHGGVDFRGVVRALLANLRAGQTTQGASTITQQFVRLALTYFADHPQEIVEATEETTARKLREMRLAMAVEKEMSKDEILERYLNLAYFGEGAYGIFAASQVYFGKKPMDLELHEAAMLAGIIKAPTQFSPAAGDLEQATARRNWVLDQMVETGAITAEEAAEAKQIPLNPKVRRQPNECVNTVENHWGFFCDYFFRWWMEQEEFGATPWERERRLKGGGYHIVTTLDVDLQAAMKKHVEEALPTSREEPRALMLAAVEPGTGKVRAMATNRNFSLDDKNNGPHTDPEKRQAGLKGTYPNTTNPLISGGGDIYGYQHGSTAKVFTVVAALESGLPLDHNIYSPHQVVTRFPVEPGGPASCRTPSGYVWCPSNYAGAAPGVYNMWTGLGASINTYFAQLIQRVGADKVVDAAKRMGFVFRDPEDISLAETTGPLGWGAFTLGVALTTPLDLANMFATLSAEGIHCDPIPVEEIRDAHGQVLDLARPNCERTIKRNVALAAIDAGKCVVGSNSHFGECRSGGTARFIEEVGPTTSVIPHPVWGKTGTADGSRTYSFVLSTKQLTVAGQMADPDWAETTVQMDPPKVRKAVTLTLRDGMKGKERLDWDRPSDMKLVYGPRVQIPNVECLTVEQAQARLTQAGFDVSVERRPVDSACPPGRVAGTDPAGTTSRGAAVAILISNGSDYEEEDDDEEGGGEEQPPRPRPGPTGPPERG